MRRRLRRHWTDALILTRVSDDHALARVVAADALRPKWGGQIYYWSTLVWLLSQGRASRAGLEDTVYALFMAVASAVEGKDADFRIEQIKTSPTDRWEQTVIADPMSMWDDLDSVKADLTDLLRTVLFAEAWRPVEHQLSESQVTAAMSWARRQAFEAEWGDIEIEFPRTTMPATG